MALPATKQRFDMARVIGMTLGLICRNVVTYLLLTLATVTLPNFVLTYFVFGQLGNGTLLFLSDNNAAMVGALVVSAVGNSVLQAIITRAATEDLTGQPVQIMDAIRAAASVFVLLVGLGFLTSVAVYLGLILLFVPGVILWVRWCVATPALAAERLGILEAMRRSVDLTSSHRWAIFGLAVFFSVAWFALNAIAPMIAGALGSDYVVFAIVNSIVDTFVTLFAATGVAAIYFELRQLKDGVDVSKIASVFA